MEYVYLKVLHNHYDRASKRVTINKRKKLIHPLKLNLKNALNPIKPNIHLTKTKFT